MTIHLDCLGSGWAFSTGSYWNGWLLDRRILLDCPSQALVHLYRLGITAADLDLVLLTHEHDDHVVYLKVNPRLDPLRPDVRFQALLERLGLD